MESSEQASEEIPKDSAAEIKQLDSNLDESFQAEQEINPNTSDAVSNVSNQETPGSEKSVENEQKMPSSEKLQSPNDNAAQGKQVDFNRAESSPVEQESNRSMPDAAPGDINQAAPRSEQPVEEEQNTIPPKIPTTSSSLPRFDVGFIGGRQPGGLPGNCSYESKKLDWKKVYSPAEGKQVEPILLKDQRCETDFSYTKGTVEYTDMTNVSDTDIISHGLGVLLKAGEDQLKTVHLPNLKNVLNLMQLSPEELSSVQEWLDKKYELSLIYDKETHSLLIFVKKLLVEVRKLRENTARYRKKIQKLQSELTLHPSSEKLAYLYKTYERSRKEVFELDKEHGDVIRSKIQLHRSMNIEFLNCSKSESSLYLRIQNLRYENKTLRHLVDVFTNEARELINSLFKKLDKSIKKIKKLDDILLRAKSLLEKKSYQTKEVETHLQDQEKLVENITNSIALTESHLLNLRNNAENMKNKSSNITVHAVNLQNEIQDLLSNFSSISSDLCNQDGLQEDRKKNMSEAKKIFESLKLQKTNVKKLGKNIAMIEKHVQSTQAKERSDGANIIGTNEQENTENRQSWEEKMLRLRNYFEEVDEILIQTREDEEERKKALKEATKKETIGEAFVQGGDETIRLSGKFICSDASGGEVVTKSGVCKIAETIFPQDTKDKDSPAYGRGIKSAYAVGSQNLQSVPESVESQLHGIYTKYKLKDFLEGTNSASPHQ